MRNTKLFLGLIAPAMFGLAVLPGCVSTCTADCGGSRNS